MKKSLFISFLVFVFTLLFYGNIYAGELHDAAARGDVAKVKQLLEQGANIDACGESTRFIEGTDEYGDGNYFFQVKGPINYYQKHGSPLHEAAKNGHTEVAAFLIKKGAYVDKNCSSIFSQSSTPLNEAAANGHTEVAILLIEKGAPVKGNAGLDENYSPLHEAAREGKTEIAELLIQKGANVNAKGGQANWHEWNGYTPLHEAARTGKTQIVELLIKKGANVNAIGGPGDKITPFMVAEINGHSAIATILQKAGGSATKKAFLDAIFAKLAAEKEYYNDNYIDSKDLRAIVRLVRSTTPAPAIPQEAKDMIIKGMAAFKLADCPSAYRDAYVYFREASYLAPWWPVPHFNMGLSAEQAKAFNTAKESFEKYLIAAPNAKDANNIKMKIAELEIKGNRTGNKWLPNEP